MKRLIPFILLLIFFSARDSYGQKIRFTDTSNIWIETFSHPDYTYTYKHYNGDDTIINGFRYVKGYGFCREDTVQNKVYLKYGNSQDTTEHLLHDYNLTYGDSFTSINYINRIPTDTFIYSVTQLDSVLINNTWHKVWTYEYVYASKLSTYYYPPYTVIEGIGCTSGLSRPLMPGIFENDRHLLCFENNGSIITVPIPTGGYYLSPQTCALSVASNVGNNKTTTISPNPANSHSKITFPNTIQVGTLTITDILGRRLISKSIINQTAIPIGELPAAGVYFYTITDNYNQSLTGKFIYE